MIPASEIMSGPAAPSEVVSEYDSEWHYWASVEGQGGTPIPTELFREIGQRMAALTSVVYGDCRVTIDVDRCTLPDILYSADQVADDALPVLASGAQLDLAAIAQNRARINVSPIDESMKPAWAQLAWFSGKPGELSIYAQDAHNVNGRPLKNLMYQRLLCVPGTPPNKDFNVFLGIANTSAHNREGRQAVPQQGSRLARLLLGR